MDNNIVLILAFGLGIIAQSLISIRSVLFNRWSMFKVVMAILVSLVFISKGLTYIIYCVVIGSLFKKEILPKINGQILLQLSLIFIYCIFVYFNIDSALKLGLVLTTLIIIFLLIFFSLAKTQLGYLTKLSFYIWFLVINIVLLIINLFFTGTNIFAESYYFDAYFLVNVFLSGMVFFYLATNAFYIFELIPIPDKHESYTKTLNECKKNAMLLTMEYQDQRLEPIHTMIIIFIQGGVLVANYFLKIIPATLMINIYFLLVQLLLIVFLKTPAQEIIREQSVSERL